MRCIQISLFDTIESLRSQYKDYVITTVQNGGRAATLFPNNSWELNHLPFMEHLLSEIFSSQVTKLPTPGSLSPTQAYLVQHGVDVETTQRLVAQAYKEVIDAIVTFVPDVIFGDEDSFQYGLCDVYDLMITDMRRPQL